MTITFYDQKHLQGDSLVVDRDFSDLTETAVGKQVRSMELSSNQDRLVCFERTDWRGAVMYRRKAQVISDTGSSSEGGKWGFRAFRSCRITPFDVRLRVHIIRDSNGAYPADLPDFHEAFLHARKLVARAMSIWSQGLIQLLLATEDVVEFGSADLFNYRNERGELNDLDLREGYVNVVLCNLISNKDASDEGGVAFSGHPARLVVGVAEGDSDMMGDALAHEIGHIFGLGHENEEANLMFSGTLPVGQYRTVTTNLRVKQIERAHAQLADGDGKQKGLRVP